MAGRPSAPATLEPKVGSSSRSHTRTFGTVAFRSRHRRGRAPSTSWVIAVPQLRLTPPGVPDFRPIRPAHFSLAAIPQAPAMKSGRS